jgi:Ca2+-binding EF-hand superfamily protein
MLGLEAQRRLKNFFAAVADGERDLEAARCRLCNIPDFAPRAAFSRVDRDCSATVSNGEICNFLRDNGIHHVSESEAYNLVKFFDADGNSRLSFDEWVQMNLPCEDNYLRDRTMARFAPALLRHEALPRDIELAMCDVIEKEIALQRNLESLKADLHACVEYSPSAAHATVDVYRSGVLNTINIADFMRSQGSFLSELELVAIVRRIDTDGSCSLTLREFSEFMAPLAGVKPVYASPARTVSTRYSSPVRVRTTASLLESPVRLARSFSVERRVPLVTTVSPYPYRPLYDLDYPVWKYRYLDYPYYSRYASPYYSRYVSPYSPVYPYGPAPYRSYWSTALGRYVAV